MKNPVSGIIAKWLRSSPRVDAFVQREFRTLARVKERHGSVPSSMVEELIAHFGLTNSHGRPASIRNFQMAMQRVEARIGAVTAARRDRAKRAAGWRNAVEATGVPFIPGSPPGPDTTGPPATGTAEDMIEELFERFRTTQPQMPIVPDRKVTP